METTVRSGGHTASYITCARKRICGSYIPLRNYKQDDWHSCGFVAALTVARYFDPGVSDQEVLRAVRPYVNFGTDRHALRDALRQLGMYHGFCVDYRKDLTVGRLRKYVDRGVPVIVSVYGEDWFSDHWTIVQGFSEDRVYLTNHYSLTIEEFKQEWSNMDTRHGWGNSKEGLVCALPCKSCCRCPRPGNYGFCGYHRRPAKC